ncbi:MAG: hypothetical protein AAGG55_16535 [Pseudomonadota bacterium]
MARPSKKDQRREEIVDAFRRCVIRWGVAGATLQRVANESGLARPLIHHNLGNRDDLLEALLSRLEEESDTQIQELKSYLPNKNRCAALVNLLFDPQYASGAQETLLYQALFASAQDSARLRKILLRWQDDFIEELAVELRSEYPMAAKKQVAAVAVGIAALYFHADSISPLSSDTKAFRLTGQAANTLLESLSWNG